VDIDLALEGCATKVSREQAHIKLRGGHFKLINIGRRAILVNNCLVESGHVRTPSLTPSLNPRRGRRVSRLAPVPGGTQTSAEDALLQALRISPCAFLPYVCLSPLLLGAAGG